MIHRLESTKRIALSKERGSREASPGARYRPSMSPDQGLGIGAAPTRPWPLADARETAKLEQRRPQRLSSWQLDRNVEAVVAERKFKVSHTAPQHAPENMCMHAWSQ